MQPGSAKQQLAARGLHAKKTWGQNFLQDLSVLACIADADASSAPAFELGAGLGALTEVLCSRGRPVVAVERDRDLVPTLRALAGMSNGQLRVVEGDAQQVDYAHWAAELAGPVHVFGNLPYQLSGRILVMLADAGESIAQATLLVQREVAERLVAGPPGRTYGLLSVLVQRRFSCSILRHVSPGAFYPRPNVDSAVIRLLPHAERAWAKAPAELADAAQAATYVAYKERWLVACARAAFSARRKTLRNSLQTGLKRPALEVEAALARAGIDPGARAETLTVAQFAALGEALFAGGSGVGPMPVALAPASAAAAPASSSADSATAAVIAPAADA